MVSEVSMDIVVAIIGSLILAQLIDGRVAFGIGFLVVLTFRLMRRQQFRKMAQQLGLSEEEMALLKNALQRGKQEEAMQYIAAAQQRKLAEFQAATGIDVAAITPVIGFQISWSDVVRQVFRICDFDRSGTTIGPNDQVHALSPDLPYGYLLVESPILNQRAQLPVIHCDDFRLAANFFDEPPASDAIEKMDFLVTYVPKQLRQDGRTGSAHHVLHYVIAPRGTLERYYAVNNDQHMRNPKPEKLFGPFIYEGEIGIQMNHVPRL